MPTGKLVDTILLINMGEQTVEVQHCDECPAKQTIISRKTSPDDKHLLSENAAVLCEVYEVKDHIHTTTITEFVDTLSIDIENLQYEEILDFAYACWCYSRNVNLATIEETLDVFCEKEHMPCD